jgi:hypothetical protein
MGMFFAACPAYCTDYYVAPDGNDSNDGSIDHPFKTIGTAVNSVGAGGTIFLRGGQHDYISTITISKNGTDGNLITLQAYQDEVPILDFSGEATGSKGIALSGSYWHFKGFVIQNAGHNGLRVTGSYNVIEQLVTRRNRDTGLHLDGSASHNLVVDCDSYLNYDAVGWGEDADGFAAKSATIGAGNIFRRCRSWNNADDGYDFYNCGTNGVRLEDCWAFRNGINLWGIPTFLGDGNGYKLGPGNSAHVLVRCMAYDNPHHGFLVNHNTGGLTVYNCTGVKNNVGNGRNFYFDEHSSIHKLRNNLSHMGLVKMFDEIDDANNSWNYYDAYGWTVGDANFASLDPNFPPITDPNTYTNANSIGIDRPREPDGGLPKLPFLRLSAGCWLIDAGIDVNEPFEGDAPDLGAFEHIDGDCQTDGIVDLADFARLASNWLNSNCGTCNGADFDGNGTVDWYDFAVIADNWLKYY